jgi:SAM-dependent methyltransferase
MTTGPGWVNIDASINALLGMVRAPRAVIDQAYRLSGARSFVTLEAYRETLLEHRHVHHQIVFGLPFENGTVDYVYSSHFLEHLFRDEAGAVVGEAFRVLRTGGTIRITVPDLQHVVSLYQAGRKNEALGFFFPTSRDGELSRHRFLYDLELMSELLASAGFTRIRRCEFQQGDTPDLVELDNRPDQTLYVEATKA